MDRWCSGLYKVVPYYSATDEGSVERVEPVPWQEAEVLVPGFGAQKVFDLDEPDGPANMAGWLMAARFVLKSQSYVIKYIYYTVRGTERRSAFERPLFNDTKV